MKLLLCVAIQIFILALNFAIFYATGFVYATLDYVSLYVLPTAVFFAWEVLYVCVVLKIYDKEV